MSPSQKLKSLHAHTPPLDMASETFAKELDACATDLDRYQMLANLQSESSDQFYVRCWGTRLPPRRKTSKNDVSRFEIPLKTLVYITAARTTHGLVVENNLTISAPCSHVELGGGPRV